MLYYLFDWLHGHNFPGAGMFQYISFRAALAIVLSLFISLIIGKSVIKKLQKAQIGETIRDLGLEGQLQKKGTPTMGGIIIIASIIIPVLLVNKLDNIYIILMIFTTLWLGCLGFADDYIKVFKKNKEGLSGKKKLIGQIILGLIVGIVMCFHPDVVIKEKGSVENKQIETTEVVNNDIANHNTSVFSRIPAQHNSTKTTIPFVKNNEFDYAWLTNWTGDKTGLLSSLVYILVVIFIIAAVSNGANLTDGLDGLAISTAAIICIGIAILAYVSGNSIFADYLNIMYIPNIGELVVFIAALLGACLGFYWWNCFPAQVFMGDTGSLSLGGIIAVLCIIIRKELLIPVLCGIYLIESVSVIIQTSYFKYTKKKTGEGKRIFLMAPIHHHYQKKGMHETKIVQRFIIIGILLAVISVVTLKVR
jgi:phospho-N-acetylmuramoyl-pentapeptide-transferase